MKKQIIICLISALPAFAQQGKNRYYDAMELAIDHFNRNHAEALIAESAKHVYMMEALRVSEELIPQLKEIHKMSARYSSQSNPYKNLVFEKTIGETGSENWIAAARAKTASILELTKGCAVETTRTTTDKNFDDRKPIVTTQYTIQLNSKGEAACENKKTIKALKAQGINTVFLTEKTGGGRIYSGYSVAIRFFIDKKGRDVLYVKKNLETIPEFKNIAEKLKRIDERDFMITNASSAISVVNSNGEASLGDPVVLRFSKGWGDCPSGCIYHHQWYVRVTPTENRKMEAVLVGESGDPLWGQN